jgi:predicted DNA-binding protein YlxM (UPF0122 family)
MVKDRRKIYHGLMNNKKSIIEKYNNGMKVIDIAKIYGVAVPTIYVKLKQWETELNNYKGELTMDEEQGVYDILYECPACGKQENMTVETWYAWDAPICECGQEMGEVSREMEF